MTFQALADAIYHTEQQTSKPATCLDIYERLFDPLRDAPLALLELGIHSGHSMHRRHRYFPKA